MDERTEKAYSPKEVFTTLDIGDSTLRKWCLALEKHGYGFIRNDQNTRVYVESDLVVLRHFQNLVKQHNIQLENAATLVIDRFGKGTFEVRTGIVPVEKEEEHRDLIRSDEVINKLLEHIKQQEEFIEQQKEFNRELLNRLDQQQKYIDERLEQRDQKFMESLRESQETKQQLLQLAAAHEEETKKGFFARLFGK